MAKLLKNIATFFNTLYALLFPHICNGCGNTLSAYKIPICANCLNNLSRTHFEKRPYANPVYQIIHKSVPIRYGYSIFYFNRHTPIQHFIYAFKYDNRPDIAFYLGAIVGEILMSQHNILTDINYILPIPLYDKKERQRGYNQAYEISKGISHISGHPIITDLLKRKRYTQQQAKLTDQHARLQNMQNAFSIHVKSKACYDNKHFLIIDDIITTGATISSALQALSSALPQCQFSVITLASSDLNK